MAIENAQNFSSKELVEMGYFMVQRLTYTGGKKDGQIKERALDYEESLQLRKAFRAVSDSVIDRNGTELTAHRQMKGYSIRYDFFSVLPRGCCADHYLTFDRASGQWLNGEQYRAAIA